MQRDQKGLHCILQGGLLQKSPQETFLSSAEGSTLAQVHMELCHKIRSRNGARICQLLLPPNPLPSQT